MAIRKKPAVKKVGPKKPSIKKPSVKKPAKKKFLQAAEKKMEKKGTKGAFSAAAKKAGMSTQAYAREKEHAPGKLGKRARFALMAGKLAKKKKAKK